MIQRVKGTQDFLDMTLFNFLIDSVKQHLKFYHFNEIKTPILEPLELFKRSLGLETDVITKEMYTVNSSIGEDAICLRPEATVSTLRAFLEHSIQSTPWKVFSYGPMFRHERPQKGRYREFNQCNIEIIGSDSIAQDAQFIKMLERFFAQVLHLDTYGLLINFLGCPEDRAQFKKILYEFLNTKQEQICALCTERKEKNILRIFDCKNPTCQALYRTAPHIADHVCPTCNDEWTTLKHTLEVLSVSYSYAPTLVRGLDYYDKTVFEFVSMDLGAQNAFCSGGRYNHLASQLGSKHEYPSIGAAMGIERILLMLESIKDKLPLQKTFHLHALLPLTKEQHTLALLIADELQAQDVAVDILLEGDSLKSMMRKADKLHARYVIMLGPDEQRDQKVRVKDMETGTEETLFQRDIVSFFKR